MKCPDCGGKTTVTDVVHVPDTNESYRARKCLNCGRKIYTVEFEVEYNESIHKVWYDNCRYYTRRRNKT